VPNRNGVLVNLAAALAEARGAEHVVVGFNAEEAETFPDNSTRFLDSLNRCLEDSTRGRVSVVCPTGDLTKAQLLTAGRAAGAPIDLTWSCYEDGSQPCGRCESCVRRQRAIERAATPE
jgi:7-cyano-7-deazaguanine synthase